ncbi:MULTISPECIES: sodium-translocating pyrophosphatase [unclassified Modestobacter]|uniref:sodium-translocating pyrophosphatase n=1 Tax=unclassified Modestobacter TaxID=2643866 RepID=UPI0022AAD16F|nr:MULTISPECIES: sodium-translocating pyrophosphatase [unclassified Modestobacter]MCZ2810676.1 sodium-translocating pyrophosphatase [Modestobacter sp. VKM Ac-2979]MCZ2842162.1 sodium-translocating pyrophosphatase [Modestobacter sp. VKM Ac-2980]MCZ2846799.1 sodium-translocating pyrophosphatase [Modestobacter sp. VKM Ac-2978]
MPDADLSGGDLALVAIALLISLAALGFAAWLVRAVLAADQGTASMQEIAKAIQEGAGAYLRRQYRTLAVFAAIVFGLLLLLPVADGGLGTRLGRAAFFLVGAAFSAAVGFIGMTLATRGNVRVAAAAAAGGHRPAFRIAFRTGGVCGMITVGLGLFGASLVLLLFRETAPIVLEGFAFGGALLAMFMRVGGGIFTKAADVGADLVGKVEAGIPEDDPRNAATIADNVGDNVGDCAGMAADLFESYAVTLVAALILGQVFFGPVGMVFPLVVAAIGVIASVVGILASNPGSNDRNWMSPINRGFFVSAAVSLVLVAAASFTVLPTISDGLDIAVSPQVLGFLSVLIGIVLAAAIQQLTGYFTETSRRPVRDVGRSSLTGPATVILSGISLGLESAVYAALLIGTAVYGAFLIGGAAALYAVALAGCGLLTTAGVIVSMDTFGPVSDNAQGIAEMSGDIDEEGAQVLTDLDAVGNTTKAITKGIAIATAVLAATALFGSYNASLIDALDDAGAELGDALTLVSPNNVVGAVIGAAVVFLFSGLAISAVSRAAGRVVFEVREQFRMHPGIMDYTERPDYSRVVDICTRDSLRELATPGLLAVLAPVAVGFGLGFGPLAAYLVGAIATGTLMAVFLSNSGGAWDNAKKMVEDGAHGGKGSKAHEATIIGDTVGDPFKDTAGPAINPLIKVMNLVALLIAPAVVGLSVGEDANTVLRLAIAIGATLVIVVAVVVSKRRSSVVGGEADTPAETLTEKAY